MAELREASDPDYNNKIRVKTISDQGERVVAGAFFRQNDQRVVEIDGYHFDVVPHGHL